MPAPLVWSVVVATVFGCGRVGFTPESEAGDSGPGSDAAAADGPPLDGAPAANLVFVTSTTHQMGTLGSLLAADAVCQARADAAGLDGTFVAWLSTSTVDAKDRLGTARGWIRRDGTPFADSISSLTSGAIFYPVRHTEEGEEPSGFPYVVTATTPAGTYSGTGCSDLTSTSGAISQGYAWGGSDEWTSSSNNSCDGGVRFYCFGIDRTVAVLSPSVPGRRAFVSDAAWQPGGGIASADALCAGEADTAGLAGSFRALLASDGVSAMARFTAGSPWVRVDGALLGSDLLTVEAAFNVTASGVYRGTNSVWTGAPDVSTPGSATCASWTSTSASEVGAYGYSTRATAQYFSSGIVSPCDDSSRHIYCLEE
jgi:hypothetical protein